MSKYYKGTVGSGYNGELINEESVGETIEAKVRRVVELNEPITDGAPLIYTEKKDGVMPGYNVRTDKWDIAVDAMGSIYSAKPAVLASDLEAAAKVDSEGLKTPPVNERN